MRLLPFCVLALLFLPLPAHSEQPLLQSDLQEFVLASGRMRDEEALAAALTMLGNAKHSLTAQSALVLLTGTTLRMSETNVTRSTLDNLRRLSPSFDASTARRLEFCRLELLRSCGDPDECRRQLAVTGLDQPCSMSPPLTDTDNTKELLEEGRRANHPLAGSPDGIIRPGLRYPDPTAKAFYLRWTITNNHDDELIFTFGCAGGLQLFLDGQPFFDYASDNFGYLQQTRPVTLAAGTHVIEAILRPGNAGPSFCASLAIAPADDRQAVPDPSGISDSTTNLFLDMLLRAHDGRATTSDVLKLRDSCEPDHPLRAAILYFVATNTAKQSERMRLLQDCLRADNSHLPALHDLALDYLRLGQPVLARQLVERAMAINPHSSRLLLLQQKCLLQSGRTSEAETIALALDAGGHTDEAVVARYLAAWYRQDARAVYRFARALYLAAPSDMVRAEELRASLAAGSSLAERESDLNRLQAAFPDHTAPQLDRARLLLDHNRRAEAIAILSALEQRVPRHPEVHRLLARALAGNDLSETAAWHCARAGVLDSQNTASGGTCALAATDNDPLRQLQSKPDLENLISQARAFSDEPVINLYEEHIVKVLDDGSFLHGARIYRMVNNPDQAPEAGMVSVILDRGADRVLRLAGASGGNKEIRYRFAPLAGSDSGVYHQYSAVELLASRAAAGDIVRLEYLIHYAGGRRYQGYTGGRVVLDSPYRTLRTRLICAGKHMTVFAGNAPFTRYTRNFEDNTIQIFENNGLPPRTGAFLPAITPATLPGMVFTNFDSWSQFDRWYLRLLEGQDILPTEAIAEMQQIISGATTAREKAARINAWITGRTRYVSIAAGISGFQPRPVAETWRSAYGDCKDIALLLAALLREAGLEARMVLASTADNGRVERQISFPGFFNHALCRVVIDGHILYIDGTNPLAGLSELPETDRQADIYLPGRGFETVNTSAYAKTREYTLTDLTLDRQGNATGIRQVRKSGDAAISSRSQLTSAELQQQDVALWWNMKFPGAKITGFTQDSIQPDRTLHYQYSLELPGLARQEPHLLRLPLALYRTTTLQSHAPWISIGTELPIPVPWRYVFVTRYTLPEGYSLTGLPANRLERTAHCVWKRSCRLDDRGRLVVRYAFALEPSTVNPEQYAALRRLLTIMALSELDTVTLKEAGNE